jgi:hypothetical protein
MCFEAGLPGSKNKKAKFGHSPFQKGLILKNEKGKIFFKNLSL